MDIITWIKNRSPGFILQRGQSLIDNYGTSPTKATHRIDSLMACFSGFDCAPTFPVPGRVIERHASYIRSLQDRGAEIAVHGYNHVDLKACDAQDGAAQLLQAVRVFEKNGLTVHGFRCPYLSCSDALLESLPEGIFNYSSNKAIRWDLPPLQEDYSSPLVFETIGRFYDAIEKGTIASIPWMKKSLVEIPVSVPDDLQLKDGLGYTQEDLAETWVKLLMRTYDQGEIFNLMFHPELASFCNDPFIRLLQTARDLQPKVWISRLCDIATWWREKNRLTLDFEDYPDGTVAIRFPVSTQARWKVKGFALPGYSQTETLLNIHDGSSISLPPGLRPFVGIDRSVDNKILERLSDLGFITDQGQNALKCPVYLDKASLQQYPSETTLLSYLEGSSQPLIRLWPWPDGYRSALCITGDLDALSLMDYLNRLSN